VVEVNENLSSDYDLNMNVGGKFKMNLNFKDNLFEYANVIAGMDEEDIPNPFNFDTSN